jgi:glyceraldehyde 3-phosphate dehydrogenase
MTVRVGINGFGRIGRLALRESWGAAGFEIVHINEIAGDAKSAAHLLRFDSVHGTWNKDIRASYNNDQIIIDGQCIGYSQCASIDNTPWQAANVDLVVECTGTLKTEQALAPYFAQGHCQRSSLGTNQRPARRHCAKCGDGGQ